MKSLQATFSAIPTLPNRRFSSKLPRWGRYVVPTRKVVIRAQAETNGRDYDGRLVDENMIVLRMRIRDMKMAETSHDMAPSGWMEWEKKYYVHYNEDVCEAVGTLQSVLMNTRPGLALGMVVLLVLSVPFSSFVAIFQAMEMAKRVLFIWS